MDGMEAESKAIGLFFTLNISDFDFKLYGSDRRIRDSLFINDRVIQAR